MYKSALAAVAALPVLGSAAFAGPYVNVEANAGYTGNDYNAVTTDLHVGYEGDISDEAGYYIQVGPSLVAADGEATTTEFSGKAGVGVDVAENVNVYGEVAFITVDGDNENDYGLKAGVKYSF